MSQKKCIVKCRECRFSQEMKTALIGTWVAECRRFPPILLILPGGADRTGMFSKWPIVQDDATFFCYEGEPRPGALIANGDEVLEQHDRNEALNEQQEKVEHWNKKFQMGQNVVIDEYESESGRDFATWTNSPAFILNSQAVVRCGYLGGIFPLNRIRATPGNSITGKKK